MPETEPLSPPQSFVPAARALGIEFEPGDLERLGRYLALLLSTNERFNLTAVTDPEQAWTRHVLDSLTLVPFLAELPPGGRVIDIGSGGGLPGVPLAIVLPQLRFTLLEATGKKAEFLRSCVDAVGLTNIGVLNARAERAGQDPEHRERYDAVTARAVGPLSVLAEITVPFARPPEGQNPSGRVLLIKGQKAPEELRDAKQALHILHAAHVGTFETPTGKVVVLEKLRKTPTRYPRREGEPKRPPLGA
jgi:16S rRNA (guanine527-N7)-methyltransferase